MVDGESRKMKSVSTEVAEALPTGLDTALPPDMLRAIIQNRGSNPKEEERKKVNIYILPVAEGDGRTN
ncbi:uncharacterized protein N7500_007047 [Penicillium coprophilum]|uniref:uncharacterized protein n=1 Tax=Penicillium coprophilum TaxID=36646 RepID=UPI002383A848|nr:uncharacterized protein N7500_007047 [Penicillium coprophilum]KAJ5165217.1 hypothetical protein N7500_007047 [Penicillium coprophilum]